MPGKLKTRQAHTLIEKAGGEDYIYGRVADGATLKQLAEELGISRPILSGWCNHTSRRDAYVSARREAALAHAEEGLAIVDSATPETASAAKLRSDYRKYLAAKLDPRTWGDPKAAVTIDLGQLHLEAVKQIQAEQREQSLSASEGGTDG